MASRVGEKRKLIVLTLHSFVRLMVQLEMGGAQDRSTDTEYSMGGGDSMLVTIMQRIKSNNMEVLSSRDWPSLSSTFPMFSLKSVATVTETFQSLAFVFTCSKSRATFFSSLIASLRVPTDS
jgi:hypothetical protein